MIMLLFYFVLLNNISYIIYEPKQQKGEKLS